MKTLNKKSYFLLAMDGALIFLSGLLAALFLSPYVALPPLFVSISLLFLFSFYSLFAILFGVSSSLYRYTSLKDMLSITVALTLSTFFTFFIVSMWSPSPSIRFTILVYIFALISISAEHIGVRLTYEYKKKKENSSQAQHARRLLLVGAGEAGRLFVQQVKKTNPHLHIVGVVDDDPKLHFKQLGGIPVLGPVSAVPALIENQEIDQITIAIPSLRPQELEKIVRVCRETAVPVNQIPSVEDVMKGKLSVQRFKEIDVLDLLGREEVELDIKLICEQLKGKTVLISGAGGSIGSEISRIIASFQPKKVILLGHGENSIYQIHQQLKNKYGTTIEFTPIIADIQDEKRILNVMQHHQPNFVYHAAAHKHVPMMESNPFESIKNNVYGTWNMASASKNANVEAFVMISTDKAVNPPNVMGATKRIAEMIVTTLNESGKTKFAVVRFGNVLGSRGSVVPLFKKQIQAGGPITVTDMRMTRYFMTIPEASRLVIQAGALAKGGELFVLDMGEPVKIADLAKNMIRFSGYTEKEIPIVESGIRPGEKLYEELLIPSEDTGKMIFDKIMVGKQVKGSIPETFSFLQSLETLDELDMKKQLINYARNQLTDVSVEKEKADRKHIPMPEYKPLSVLSRVQGID